MVQSTPDENAWLGTSSRSHTALRPLWTICLDMYNLSETFLRQKANGKSDYVVKHPKEPDNVYHLRLDYAMPMNFMGDAVVNTAGMLSDKYDIDVSDYKDPDILEWLVDMTGKKESIFALAANMASSFWLFGTAPWRIDYSNYKPEEHTQDDGNMTLAKRNSLNLRPYVVLIPPLDLIEATGKKIDGVERPVRLRVQESGYTFLDIETGELFNEEKEFTTVILLTVGNYERFLKKDGKFESIGNGKSPHPEGEGVLAGAVTLDDRYYMMGYPPFLEVALYQCQLMDAEATSGHIVGISQSPVLFGTKMDTLVGGRDDTVAIGSVPFVKAGDGADLKYVEISGQSIQAGVDRIERLSSYAKAVGGQMYSEPDSSSSATSIVMATQGYGRYFELFVSKMETNLTQIIAYMGARAGIEVPEEACVRINKKGEVLDPSLMDAEEGAEDEEDSDSAEAGEKKDTKTLQAEEGDEEGQTSVTAFIDNTEKL